MGKLNLDLDLGFDVTEALKELEKENEELNKGKKRKRILVVDDERTMLKTIKGLLEKDYDVTTIANGRSVKDYFVQKDADLILLDYEMPVFSGADVLKELRKGTRTRKIPVIFITGVNTREKINEVLSFRPNAYLLKPIDKVRLFDEIEKILNE